MRMTIVSVLSHLVVRPRLFYKINENKSKRKINNDLAVMASHIPVEAIHDRGPLRAVTSDTKIPLKSNIGCLITTS